MSKSDNIWDNILVDISAEFEGVKISLGEIKQISEGLVVDIHHHGGGRAAGAAAGHGVDDVETAVRLDIARGGTLAKGNAVHHIV